MESIKVRLPYIDEMDDISSFVLNHIDETKRTDLSKYLDKDRFNNALIMIVHRDRNRVDTVNQSYNGKLTGYRASWYEFLLPILKLSDEDFDKVCENINESGTVELGSFPATRVTDQNIIDSITNGRKEYTGNSYTLPINNHFKGETSHLTTESKCMTNKTRVVEMKSFLEYEIDGERYITFKENDIDEGFIYRVEPLRWFVDFKNKELMCTTLPVTGIIYNPRPHSSSIHRKEKRASYEITYREGKHRKISYNRSQVCKYLENNFIKEAILNQVSKKEITETKDLDPITALINEISVYAEYYHGTEDINEIINELITKYNEDLDNLKTKSGLMLYSEEGLHLKLISDLNRLLDKLKSGSESSKEYCDILKLINDSIDILNGKELEEIDNELLKDIQTITTEILPQLSSNPSKQNEIRERLLKELTSDRDKVKSYLEYMNSLSKSIILRQEIDLGFKTPKEYELNFRIRMQPILERLFQISLEEERQVIIDKRNELLKKLESENATKDEVNYELYRILESHYKNDYKGSSIISTLLKEINRLVKELKSYGIKPEPAFNVDLPSDDINKIIESLDKIIINLYKMIINTKADQERVLRINSYKYKQEL